MRTLAAVACVALCVVAGAAGAAADARSSWSGVYTEQQATAGEAIYYAKCSTCHGDDLAGLERAPALAGPQFLDAWNGKDLRRLLDRVESMPPVEPVKGADAINMLAFLLRASEMPPGSTALPADRATLAAIMMRREQP